MVWLMSCLDLHAWYLADSHGIPFSATKNRGWVHVGCFTTVASLRVPALVVVCYGCSGLVPKPPPHPYMQREQITSAERQGGVG